jgi:hypothetical protein
MGRRVTGLMTRGDVKKREFVGALIVIATCNLDRITGVTNANEINPFYDPAPINIETGNDSLGQRH